MFRVGIIHQRANFLIRKAFNTSSLVDNSLNSVAFALKDGGKRHFLPSCTKFSNRFRKCSTGFFPAQATGFAQ